MNETLVSTDEILKYLCLHDKVYVDEALKKIEMLKREELLQKHVYEIWQDKKGSWHTYLPDETRGRILKQGKTREKIEDIIVKHYHSRENNPTLKQVFDEWIASKLMYEEIQKGSADRYGTDFERFFKGSSLYNKPIKNITEDELEEFLRMSIVRHKLTYKTYSGLRLLVRGIFKYALHRKYTSISISNFFEDLDIPKSVFKKNVKCAETEIFYESELPVIKSYLISHPTMLNLGLLLDFEIGTRVGELAALKRSDWHGSMLKIRRTEYRYKDADNKTTVDVKEFTKTDAGMRDILLPESARETLKMIVALNPNGEYLFEYDDGRRMRGNAFNRHLSVVLKNLGLNHRSSHKIRKTYCSILLDGGVDESLVNQQVGHSSIDTTKRFYYFNNKGTENQLAQIQQAISG